MDINQLLNEALTPEMAKLIQEGIATAVNTQVEAKLQEAKDAATAQAIVAQKAAEEKQDICNQYDVELKKAAKEVAKLEKFYKDQSKVAVDTVLDAYNKAEKLEEHYVAQLELAAQQYISETSKESVSALRESLAKHVTALAETKEQATKYGEYIREATLAEMQDMVNEATQEFIKENQTKFDQLDTLARYQSTFNTIKESFEKIGFGMSEDLAYQGLEEALSAKDTEVAQLKESLAEKDLALFESQKAIKFGELTESLSSLKREKLKKLSESIHADDITEYGKTLNIIIESFNSIAKDDTAKTDTAATINEGADAKTVADTKNVAEKNGLNTVNESKTINFFGNNIGGDKPSKDEIAKAFMASMR